MRCVALHGEPGWRGGNCVAAETVGELSRVQVCVWQRTGVEVGRGQLSKQGYSYEVFMSLFELEGYDRS